MRPLPRTFEVKSLGDFAAGLPEELLLCPVRSLSAYVTRTFQFVNRPRRLFLFPRCPSRAMSKNGISYLLREVIAQSGASSQSEQAPRALGIRGIATSSAFFRNWSCGACWRRLFGVPIPCLLLFTYGICSLFLTVFILWGHLLLLVNALVSLHLFLTSSGGGGSTILVPFP